MPQLDLVSYLGQYSWVLVGFCFLYLLIVSVVLPVLQKHLGLRLFSLSWDF